MTPTKQFTTVSSLLDSLRSRGHVQCADSTPNRVVGFLLTPKEGVPCYHVIKLQDILKCPREEQDMLRHLPDREAMAASLSI